MKPQLWICAGPNGAGKSTLVAERNDARLPIVNPDIIAAQSPNITPIAAGREALAQQKAFIEAKQSFIVETTLSGRREVELMKTAKEAGFKVNLAYVGVRNSSMSLFRVGTRVQSGAASSVGTVTSISAKCFEQSSSAREVAESVTSSASSSLHRTQQVRAARAPPSLTPAPST